MIIVGSHGHVSGTTATYADFEVVGKGYASEQTEQALRTFGSARLEIDVLFAAAGRTKLIVTDILAWETPGEAFGPIRPTTRLVDVNRSTNPDSVVESEAAAVICA